MTKDKWQPNEWSSNFDKAADEAIGKASSIPEEWGVAIAKNQTSNTDINTKWPEVPALTAWDLAIGDKTTLTTFENDGFKHKIIDQRELKSQGSNLIDDQAYLYLQCESCNEILDPHTKSFKTLEDFRYNAGWQVRWNLNGMGYKVYCVKCKSEK